MGVPEQTDPLFPLPSIGDPVREDLRHMREALDACGYRCTVLGTQDTDESRRDTIQDAIRSALRSVPEGGTLLVYFSGHGMSLDGKDHVVPSNARALPDGGVDPDSLIDLDRDFFKQLESIGRPAALVFACFDACRDGAGTDALRPFHYRAPEPTQLVVANSCSPGETSGYDDDGSHFTKALAHALHPDSPHRTLNELSASVAAQLRGHEQHPWWSPAGELPHFAVAETDGIPEWVQAVSGARLWDQPCADAPELADLLRTRVTAAVRSLSGKYRRACARLPHPWRDDAYPLRVLDSFADLPAGARAPSALEKALLCGLPFVLATAQAEEFASLFHSFQGFDRFDTAELHRVMAEQDFPSLEENRVRRLHGRGETAEAWALTTWRLLHRGSGLRVAGAEGADHLADCAARLAGVLLEDVAPGHQKQLRAIIDQLSRHHLSYPSCTALDAYPGTSSHYKVGPRDSSQLNDHDLAARWSLGAALAVDVRELSDVVGEHIGTMYPLRPGEVLGCLDDASRRITDGRAVVEVLCPHGAVHEALEVHATRCREALSRLLGLRLPPDLDWLRQVPTIDVAVHPAQGAYNLPLLTFQFDQRAISHLLMGEQLYGDPALALRELYQNALDACRYRAYRYQWAESLSGGEPGWDGRIRVTQYQQDGRTVIECLDNGVGMTAEQLKELFARAGRRLSDSSAFQHELGEWQQAGIEARFNSRFGVGVLSYFMLADEITVVTRPTNIHGQASEAPLQADIVGTATLFRIGAARHDNGDVAKVQNGGTLVRLYLSADQTDRAAQVVSASRTLGELLWYTEFDTRVQDESTGHHVVWESRKLRIPDGESRSVVPADGAGGELWWVDGEGRLLADGIATTQETFGCVVNVRDQRDLRLSVSRNEVQAWDRDKAAELLAAHLPELESWPRVTLTWLLRFGQEAPRLGDELLRVFADRPLRAVSRRRGDESPTETASGQGALFRISDIGWCPADAMLVTAGEAPPILSSFSLNTELRGWRRAVLGQRSTAQPRAARSRALLGLLVSHDPGGSYEDVRTALSHGVATSARVLPAETSAADWFLCSVQPSTPHYPARSGPDAWLPVKSTARALLGWRRTLLGRTDSLPVSSALSPNTDMARIVATQSVRRELDFLESPNDQAWPWHVLIAVAGLFKLPLGTLWAEFEDWPEGLCGPLPELPSSLVDCVPGAADANWARVRVFLSEGLLGPKALRDWADRYRPLGLPVHIRRMLSYLDARESLTPEHRTLTEDLMGFSNLLERGEVCGADVARAAARAQVSLADVLDVVAQLREPLQLTLVADIEDAGICPPEWLADLSFGGPEPGASSGSRYLYEGALNKVRRLPEKQLQEGLEILGRLGVRCPVAPAALQHLWSSDTDADALALVTGDLDSHDVDGLAFVDRWEIDAAKLLWFAAHRKLTIGEAFERAEAVSTQLGAPLTVQPSSAVRDLRVSPAVWTALNEAENLDRAVDHDDWGTVTPLSVARFAYLEDLSLREAVRVLGPFREFGVSLPDLDDHSDAAFDHKPSEGDLMILAQESDGSRPAAPTDIDPLTVVRFGLVLGRTPRSVHRMLAAYRPFGMVLEFPEPDEDMGVPLWEDPVILSFAGDGQTPALRGAVGERRITWCAEAIGRPGDTEWVRERLRMYAPMFGLKIQNPPARNEEER
ncbi:caspase family protein [Streptomyces sp. NPDC008163]|uniref:caspase family protein n=1 Tax=Streptomyces sp. NPDC008163 TaxID=3364818 RepID=UPI0036E1A3B9